MMKYSNIKFFSTVNGLGVRTCVFVSGCRLHCEGCFNQEAWNFNYGNDLTEEVINIIFDSINKPYIKGISILGGEPLDDKNTDGVYDLLIKFKERFGNTKDIWLWSGYDMDYIMKHENKAKVIELCDYVVDGKFDISKRDSSLAFRGSTNQRIWKKDKNGIKNVTNI